MTKPQRRDRRVRAVLPVRLSAQDPTLRLNAATACTLDIAARGARLGGVNFFGELGAVITVERGSKRASFKVAWVGQPGTPQANQIGLECVDSIRGLWGTDLPLGGEDDLDVTIPAMIPPSRQPVAATPRVEAAGAAPAKTRDLSLMRFPCRGEVEVRREAQHAKPFRGKLRDIGPRGVFVLSREKIPAGARVNLQIITEQDTLLLRGIIRTVEPLGMYVEFFELKDAQASALYSFILKIAG